MFHKTLITLDPEPSFILSTIFGLSIPLTVYPILLAIGILLFISALISGSEIAFFSLSGQQIQDCEISGKQSDKRIITLLQEAKMLLSTILILNNLVNVAIVTLSTFATWEIAGKDNESAIVILTIIVTTAIVFFGEIMPKVLATQKNLGFARMTSGMLSVAVWILRPFSWLLMIVSNLIEKRMDKKGYEVSYTEIKDALEMATAETTPEEKDILSGIVQFSTKTVKQVMRSRIDITAIDIEDNYHEVLMKINESGFSRIPVYEETIDQIKGILYIKDLLPYITADKDFSWQALLHKKIYYVPESKKIDELQRSFQEKRVHMAIVADEYGGTQGLITMEDIIEEIVGDINDEYDEQESSFQRVSPNQYVFEGKTSLNDFSKVIGVDTEIFEVAKGDNESLGGLLLELFNKLPDAGEKVTFEQFVFTVLTVDERRIKRIRVLMKDPTKKNTNTD